MYSHTPMALGAILGWLFCPRTLEHADWRSRGLAYRLSVKWTTCSPSWATTASYAIPNSFYSFWTAKLRGGGGLSPVKEVHDGRPVNVCESPHHKSLNFRVEKQDEVLSHGWHVNYSSLPLPFIFYVATCNKHHRPTAISDIFNVSHFSSAGRHMIDVQSMCPRRLGAGFLNEAE